jgi:hypothetical protein
MAIIGLQQNDPFPSTPPAHTPKALTPYLTVNG